MLFSPFINLLTTILNSMYSTLPAWSFAFGHGCDNNALCPPGTAGAGGDGGAVGYIVGFFSVLDRFMPIHDALLPILGIQFSLVAGLLTFKGIKFVLSLIPTISAGG